MKVLLVILAIILTLNQIEINIDGTTWCEKKTNRPIYVRYYTAEDGVVYSYPEDGFERKMTLLTLLKDFKIIDNE